MKKKNTSHQFNSESCFYSHTLIILVYVFMQFVGAARGQISTPCTTSMISTFTPCMSYVTGSSYNGTLPTTGCCNSLKTIILASIDCACLIVTANVPLPTNSMVNQALTISLPSFCNSPGIPIQCQATGSPLPSSGPLLFAPPPPSPAITPIGSAATASGIVAGRQGPTEATSRAPAASPVGVEALSKTSTGKIRTVTSASGSSPSCTTSYPTLVLVYLWMMMAFKLY